MSSIDLDQAASTLYGDTTPTPTPSAPARQQPAPIDAEKAAADLYGDPADQVDEQTGLDIVYASVQREIITAGVERLGVQEAEAQQAAQVWGEVFRDADIGTTEASSLVAVGVAALANGVDDDTVHQWAIDARDQLRSEYGSTYDLALRDAKAYVAKHPKLAAYLDETGLGDHPRVVLAAARKGRALRIAGKL